MTVDSYKITWIRFQVNKVMILILAIIFTLIFSKAKSQTGLEDKMVTYSEQSTIRMAGFFGEYNKPKQLPDIVNTADDEIHPVLSGNGRVLFFNRTRPNSSADENISLRGIWYSTFNKYTGTWNLPQPLELPGSSQGHSRIVSAGYNGDTLIYSGGGGPGGKPLFISTYLEDGHWHAPHVLDRYIGDNQNSDFDIFISRDQRFIITSEELQDTHGGRDLYVILNGPDGSFRKINLGAVINSTGEESSPFMSSDGSTLFFSSTGHGGYGGYDIYVSHPLDDSWQKWSKPLNLGPAINTEGDELSFNITLDGSVACYSRKAGSGSSDIYFVPMSTLRELKDIPGKTGLSSTGEGVIEEMGLGDINSGRMVQVDK